MRKLIRAVGLGICVVLTVAACQQQPAATSAGPSSTAAAKKLTIYYIGMINQNNPFYAIVAKGALDAGKDLGVDVRYLGPEKFDLVKAVEFTETAITAHADGIVIALVDRAAQLPSAKRAADAGIPIAVGEAVPEQKEAGDPFLVYAGSSERLAGERAAQRMLSTRKPKRAVCAIHESGNAALEARCAGFAAAMQAAGVPVERLATGADAAKVEESLRAYFTGKPDADAFITLTTASVPPALKFINESGRKDILYGNFGFSPEANTAIQNGTLLFAVDQQPYLRGYVPVWWLVMNIRYKLRPVTDFLTGPFFIDKTNASAILELSKKGYR